MKKILLLTLFISSEIMAQNISRIYKADTIYFYGYDFSHAIVNTKHPINDYIFRWIAYTSKEMPPSYFEKKMYMNVIHDFSHTNKVNIEFIENWQTNMQEQIKLNNGYPLLFNNSTTNSTTKKEENTYQKILSEYSLTQEDGIGLVVLVAEMNKGNESTLLHFVFFDIKKRNIISVYDSHLSGAVGIGMYKHWKDNFAQSVYLFLQQYNENLYFDYRSEYKRKKKRMKKWKY